MFSRKQRRTKSDHNVDPQPSSRQSTKSSRSLFSLPKALSTSSTIPTDRAEDVKGPLGLNLLHSPTTPELDFIFVHGLGGNSRKTWSKSPLESHFWPKEWLPKDPAFERVRIHSYGYDSQYLKGKEDCLNVHHIGKSFLGAVSTSPHILNSKGAIVLIGHSMGGLVMKKAYILARQEATHKELADRFVSFFFLATPHRGSSSAKMLKSLLKFAYDRAYVGNLEPNSEAIQVLNDEFRHVSAGLELWSFYETQKMKLFSSLIVDPESAVLGYREEKQIPMTADHRSICKFESPEDPNYAILRNALISTVGNASVKVVAEQQKENRDQQRERTRDLKRYLGVSDILDDDRASVSEARMKGSCEWISNKASYIKWRDGQRGDDKTLWIKGKPATGKSVLAGYVVDQLKSSGHSYSYFFFKHGDKSKSSLNRCFRSLAFQMASAHSEACDAILAIKADGVSLDRVDDRTLWRILFVQGIFQTVMSRHYWVLDALDECSNHSDLFPAVLLSIGEFMPLRVLFTSRDTVHFDPDFSNASSCPVYYLNISTTDTESDLRLLIEQRTQSLAVVSPNDRAALAEKILEKSKGSFLWTILVLKELLQCHSKKGIDQVLEDVPRGMEPLYKRILDSMSQVIHAKRLAKTILMWVVCAVRPMTISELDGALTLDIDDSFPSLEESVSALCGQLVVTDKYGNVKMVHETAREFLLSSGFDSEFSINQVEAHTRMAQVCLIYLSGDEMKPPRSNRRRSSAALPSRRQHFADYACTSFSYHLSRADPFVGDTFQLVEQFLKFNVLTWIEAIADSQNLTHLTRASKRLKAYVNACAAERSPLDSRIRSIRQWTTDLARIPATFASALTRSPAAIYSCIPPFCPTQSMIHKAGFSSPRLGVFGTLNKEWDDRLMCIDFRQGQPKALRYGDQFMAVGLSSGDITLYDIVSYQEHRILKHDEAVYFVAFKPKTDLIATCGMKTIKIWDIQSGQIVHQFVSPPRPLGMEFDGDVLLIASRNNYIMNLDLGPQRRLEPVQRPWSNSNT